MTAVVTSLTLAQAFFRGPSTLLSTTRARPGLLRDANQVRGLLVAYDTFHAGLTPSELARVRGDRLFSYAHDELLAQLRLLERGETTPREVRQEVEFLVRQLGKIRGRDFRAAVARAKQTGLRLFAKFDREGVREILEGGRGKGTRKPREVLLPVLVRAGLLSNADARLLEDIGIKTLGELVQQSEQGLKKKGISQAAINRIQKKASLLLFGTKINFLN